MALRYSSNNFCNGEEKMNINAVIGSLKSPRTPYRLKLGLLKRFKKELEEAGYKGFAIKGTPAEIKLPKSPKTNPPIGAVEIYDRILGIEAQKGNGSLWAKEKFRHDFSKAKAKVLGLPDGSLLIKPMNDKRLWKNINYPKKGR